MVVTTFDIILSDNVCQSLKDILTYPPICLSVQALACLLVSLWSVMCPFMCRFIAVGRLSCQWVVFRPNTVGELSLSVSCPIYQYCQWVVGRWVVLSVNSQLVSNRITNFIHEILLNFTCPDLLSIKFCSTVTDVMKRAVLV